MAGIKYKGTDGQWHLLNDMMIKGFEVVQTSGTSTLYVMSQNAVTEIASGINETLTAHTADSTSHLTSSEKSDLHGHNNKSHLDTVTGDVGTMAYENANSYSSATEVETAISGVNTSISGVNTSISGVNDVLTAHTADSTSHLTSSEKSDLHGHSNKEYLDNISANLGTMAYEAANSYSSATEVSTALGGKSNTGHTHTSNEITAMTNYTSAVTISAISTSDNLNTAIGKLEHSLGGIKLVALSQAAYDALVDAGTTDPNTLYIVN